MNIRESGENYLETILILQQKNASVRAKDIATELSYSKPSISRAMNILKTRGYILVEDKTGFITLTDSGHKIADRMLKRHEILTEFLVKLGVSRQTAAADACRIEHVISEETFDKINDVTES